MILIVGGMGQGKLEYVLNRTGLTRQSVAYTPQGAKDKAIFAGLETWVREHETVDEAMDALLEENPDIILLCDEVGCGVVPLLPEERAWRERVGRLCCRLAQRAQRVERVFCGITMVLKGAGEWN